MTPRLLGHRGACAERPENTLLSFAHALEIGVDAIETDVHMTADGHVVVSHDPTGARMAAVDRPIATTTLAEVQSWDAGWGFVDASGLRPFAGRGLHIPTLGEALDRFPSMRFNVDVKQRSPSLVEPLLSLLRDRGAEERVTLASFHEDVIRAIRVGGHRGPTALSRREVVAVAFMPRLGARHFVGGNAMQIPLRAGPLDLSSRAFIDKCHRLGLWVDYWTVNDPIEADVLLDRGADGLISDDPARLKPIVDRYR
jgi:glycerophosphoryl diester phosphodiesterase